MKRIYTIIAAVLLTAIGLLPQQVKAQSPEKLSYQAVIRDASQNLVKTQAVGMQLSILQGSATGTIVFMETHTPTTNANGLISIEIGNGTLVSGSFNGIDWANGPYYIKTETDPNGGNAYSITGTSELLSVPYALFAKTADSVLTPEGDPIYMASIAAAINANDTTYWNAKLDSFVETDPIFAASLAAGITGIDTSYWNNKLDSYIETDPIFTSSLAYAISQLDTTHWGTVYGWGNHSTAGYFKNGGQATGADRSLGNLDSNYLTFITDSITRIAITGDGKVGIGVDTPTTDLEVGGDSKFNGSVEIEGSNAYGVLQIKETTVSHASVHNSILQISNTSNISNSQANIKFDAGPGGHGRAIISSQADGYGGTYGGLLNFKVRYGATSYHTALMIRGNGRVGIGTTNPQAPLHVNGRIYQTGLGNSTFIGGYAGYNDNLTYNNNSYVGYSAGYANTSGHFNSALGYYALHYNTGNDNTAVGCYSMNYNTTGHDNSAIGYNCLRTNSTGYYNSAIGVNALNHNTTGDNNSALGYQSLYTNISGYANVAVGSNALYYNTTGHYNLATGVNALNHNTIGIYNTANGYKSLNYNTSGNYNSALGSSTLYNNTNGYANTANGYFALYYNTTGDHNTAIGYNSLYYTGTTSYNTGLGDYARVTGTASNSTAIGYNSYVLASNRIILGNSSITYIGGHSPWYNTSDARVKRNIKEDVAGLDFILNLRPVTYYFDKDKMDELNGIKDSSEYAEKYDINNIKQSGFLAQEVEQAANKVGYDFIGLSKPQGEVKTYSLSYAMFVVPLVKATQEQQKVIEQQQQTIDEMKKELAEIKAMLLEKK